MDCDWPLQPASLLQVSNFAERSVVMFQVKTILGSLPKEGLRELKLVLMGLLKFSSRKDITLRHEALIQNLPFLPDGFLEAIKTSLDSHLNENCAIDTRYHNLEYDETKVNSALLVLITSVFETCMTLSLPSSEEIAEKLAEIQNNFLECLNKLLAWTKEQDLTNENMIEIQRLLGIFDTILKLCSEENLETITTPLEAIALILLKRLRKISDHELKNSLTPKFLINVQEQIGNAEIHTFTQKITTWPNLKNKEHCQMYKRFLKFSEDQSFYENLSDAKMSELNTEGGFSWILSAIEDYLINGYNHLCTALNVEKSDYITSPWYPEALKSAIVLAKNEKSFYKFQIGFFLHSRMIRNAWMEFVSKLSEEECRLPTVQHLICHPILIGKCFELESYDEVSKLLQESKTFLSKNQTILDVLESQPKLLEADQTENELSEILTLLLEQNGDLPSLLEQVIANNEIKFPIVLKNLAAKLKDHIKNGTKTDGMFSILCGCFFFQLVLYCGVDAKSLLQEEVKVLKIETKSIKMSAQIDRICLCLETNGSSLGIKHHPMTPLFEKVVSDNQSRLEEIQDQIPTRIEDFNHLRSSLHQWNENLMSMTFIEDLVGKLQENSVETDEMLSNWKVNILKAIRDSEEKFSSFQEHWLLASLGMTKVLRGLDALHTKKIRSDKKRLDVVQSIRKLNGKEVLEIDIEAPFKTVIKGEKPDDSWLNYTRILNLTNDEFQAHLRNHLEMAFDDILNQRVLKDKSLNMVSTLVTPLRDILNHVHDKLLEQWPDNPMLLDIVREIEKILSHSVDEPKLQFQLALEILQEKLINWNKGAHASIKINSNVIDDFLKNWRRSDLADFKSLPEVTLKKIEKDCDTKLEDILNLCGRIYVSSGKMSWILGSLVTFFHSLNSVEWLKMKFTLREMMQSRLAPLNFLREVSATFESILELFNDQVNDAKNEQVKQAERIASDMFKVLVVKRDLTCLKISREQKKLEKEILKMLTTPIPNLPLNPEEQFQNPPKKTQKVFHVFDVGENLNDLEFRATDGSVLGKTQDMVKKAKIHLNSTVFPEICDDDNLGSALDLNMLLDCRVKVKSEKECKKNDRYQMRKNLESLFKTLQAEGLSYLLGNRYQLNTVQALSHCKLHDQDMNVNLALVQFNAMLRTLKKPEKHIDKAFIERATGFSSSLIMSMLKVAHKRQSLLQNLENVWEKFRSSILDHSPIARQVEQISKGLEELENKILKDMDNEKNLVTLAKSLDTQVKTLNVLDCLINPSQGVLILETCQSLLFSMGEMWTKTNPEVRYKNVHIYTAICILRSMISPAMKGLKSMKLVKSPDSHLKTLQLKLLSKFLNQVVKVKHFASNLSKFTNCTLLEQLQNISEFIQSFEVEEMALDASLLNQAIKFAKTDCKNANLPMILEGVQILNVGLQGIDKFSDWCGQTISYLARYTCLFMSVCSMFANKKYSQDEEEEQDAESQGNEQDSGKLDGCGLGEGTGDKSTLEGIDSEDLFENEAQQDEEGQNEDKNENEKQAGEKDEFVDYSENLDAPAEDVDEASDENQDQNESEDDKDDEDFEKGDATENNKEQDDEILKPEDWGSGQDEEKENNETQDDTNAADALDEENEQKQNEQKSNDAIKDDDQEKRERLPDTEETEDVDPNMEDNIHNENHEEEPIQDLDMDDEGGIDDNMNDSDQSLEAPEEGMSRISHKSTFQ